jgi:glycine cleavage system regulatory protein
VARVTEVLAAENVNVTSFASRLENAPLSGTLVFLLDAELEIPGEADVVELEKRLAEICESEQLEFILNQA